MSKRPFAVTALNILGWFYVAFLGFYGFFISTCNPTNTVIGCFAPQWYGALLVLFAILHVFLLRGIWILKKWALFTYTGLAVVLILLEFTIGTPSWIPFVPVVLVAPMYYYFRKFE